MGADLLSEHKAAISGTALAKWYTFYGDPGACKTAHLSLYNLQ